jgi:ribosomal-protein-alanine N-acetyltransferase
MRLPPFRDGFLKHLRLDGERVFLRPQRAKDWRPWSRLRLSSRDFLAPWEPTWPADALTRHADRRRVRAQLLESRQGLGYTLHIFRHQDHALLGAITLGQIRRGVALTATLGYWIGEPFARQGYMAEAMELIMRFAFRELGLHRLEAACLPSNDASQALLKRLGFREEGMARGYLRIAGEWRDHLLFARLSEDNSPLPRGEVRA